MPSLRDNLDSVRRRIAAAAIAASRDPGEVRLLAVTKTIDASTALELLRLGQIDLGESRADVLESKALELQALAPGGPEPRWHFVGHLQGNKVRRVVRHAVAIHSVDSERLLERVAEIAAQEGRMIEVFLQVHLSGEASKHGMPADRLPTLARAAVRSAPLRFVGLMTMAPLGSEAGRGAGAVFARLADLGRALESDPEVAVSLAGGRCQLSMGMSADFEQAIAAGADIVRVGGALFEGTQATASPLRRRRP